MDVGHEVSRLPSDPWGLTAHQRRAVAVLCATGYQKHIQQQMDLSPVAAKDVIRQARAKVGVQTTIGLCIAWDRFVRGVA